jgi:2,4-dienoyl-CoA reductase-like NADH-dependent reductase (Old Yellow Enzyme family)
MPGSQHRPTFPTLFSPIRIGPMLARNRAMRVATTSNLAERHRVGERMLAFYRTPSIAPSRRVGRS